MNRLNLDHSTAELKRLIAENPDLPIVIMADESSVSDNGAWTFCSKVTFEVGEILDCEYYDYNDHVITDRDRLEEIVEDNLYDDYINGPNEVYEQAIKDKLAELEPYWKKVISIWATN